MVTLPQTLLGPTEFPQAHSLAPQKLSQAQLRPSQAWMNEWTCIFSMKAFKKQWQYKTPCKPKSYMGGHLILDRIFHTTLPHFVTAAWALGPDMASAPTSRLEPWISLYMPKKTHKTNKKSAENREKRWQFPSGHGHCNQLRYKVRDPESFFLDWPLFGDPNNSPRLCKCLYRTF